MEWFILGLLAVVLLLGMATRKRRVSGSGYDQPPYVLADHLFSPAERSFLGVLDHVLGKDFRVMGKVRVADVLGIASCQTRSVWQKAFNQVSAKHFDFLLCRPDDLQPVCAIELNDLSHKRSKRRRRDDFLQDACAAAGLPLVFFPAQRSYVPDEVRGVLLVALGAAGVPQEPNGAGEDYPGLATACRGAGGA